MSAINYFGGNILFEHQYEKLKDNLSNLEREQREAADQTIPLWRTLRLMRASNALLYGGYSVGRDQQSTAIWANRLTDFTDEERALLEKERMSPLELDEIPQRSAPLIFSGNVQNQYFVETVWDLYRSFYGEYADHQTALAELDKRVTEAKDGYIAWIRLNDKVTIALGEEMKRFAYLEGVYTQLLPNWNKRYCVMERSPNMALAAQQQLVKRAKLILGAVGASVLRVWVEAAMQTLNPKARPLDLKTAAAKIGLFFPPDTNECRSYWPLVRASVRSMMRENWQEFPVPVNQDYKSTFHNDTPFDWTIAKRWPGQASFQQIETIRANNGVVTINDQAETFLLLTQAGAPSLTGNRPVFAYYTLGWCDADVHLTYNRGLMPIPLN